MLAGPVRSCGLAGRFGHWSSAANYVLNAVLLVMVGLGALGVCAWLGRKVSRASELLVATALGAAMCFLLQMLPVVAFLAFFLLSELALGLAAVSGFGSLPRRPVPAEPQTGTR